jgi:acyl-CoA synthetase (AMP-forming)/AMP-acid ligase II
VKYRRYARPFAPLRFLNLLPLSHMFGQSMATNVPPMVRGTVIFTRSFNPHDILRLIKSRVFPCSSACRRFLDVLREHATRAWPESNEAPPQGISIPGRWWRYRQPHRAFGLKFWAFVVGAAPLSPTLEEFWRRMGFAVIQGYGLTETAPIVTLNHPFKTSKGSVGTPIGGVEVRIAEDGEILVRGENVTAATTTNSKSKFQIPRFQIRIPVFDADGWFHTGDVGERDDQGAFFIKGRKKEMIVTPEGLNVFPEDVERVINGLPAFASQRWLAARTAAKSTSTRCLCSNLAPTGRQSSARRTGSCRITSGSARRRSGRRANCREPRDAQAANARRFASGSDRARPGGRIVNRQSRITRRAVRAWPRREWRHHTRGARPVVARARRVDDCARGSLPDADG